MLLSKRSRFAFNPNNETSRIAAKLERSGKKILKLSRGDPAVYFKTPKYTVEAYVNALQDRKTYYTEPTGLSELKKAIVDKYARDERVKFSEEDVTITQGVSEALQFVNAALINDGDKAVIFRPYYYIYMPMLKVHGGSAVIERYEEGLDWDIETEKVRKTLANAKREKSRIKYMMLSNPSNPTGTVLPRKTLREIVDVANEYNLMLVSDEIYDELEFNGAKFTSVAELAKGQPHVILNGASKDYDATGFRIGYAIMPNNDRLSQALKRSFADFASMRLSVNTPAQYAFAESLRNHVEHRRELRTMVKAIERRINFATKLINESRYMHTVRPNGAFYIFPKLNMKELKIKNDKEFTYKLIDEQYVQVTMGSGFGEPNHIRIVSLAPENVLGEAIERIEKFCRRYSR